MEINKENFSFEKCDKDKFFLKRAHVKNLEGNFKLDLLFNLVNRVSNNHF